MKTVLFFSHTAELNGAELMLLQTLQRLDRTKFWPVLVVPDKGPLEAHAKEAGLETWIIPFKWWLTEKPLLWKQPLSFAWNWRSVFRLAGFMERRRVQLVLSNSAASFSGAIAARLKRIPHIWAIHEILGGKSPQFRFLAGQRALARLILWLSRRVVVNSRASGEIFGEDAKVRLVYNGINAHPEIQSERGAIREKLGFSKSDVVLGMIGRICEAKGQRLLIGALGLLGEGFPQVRLLLVGEVKDKKYFASLKKLVAQLNLEKRVHFTGFQEDVISLLHSMDCLFSASKNESFGRTLIEAMSVRTPVVAVRSGGIPEIITHGDNGYLLESREPEELKNAIVAFLEEREMFERTATRGAETVATRFSLKSQVRLLEGVMEECLE